ENIRVSNIAAKKRAQLSQDQVSGEMAPLIVDFLEMIDIDENEGERAAVTQRPVHLILRPLEKEAPAVDPGENIYG
ncbi:MAG: hypothetical protein MK138_16045, partial [Planctomycetes bacterium]|nr:hypothetical protein [Planctomycetota bacterium]